MDIEERLLDMEQRLWTNDAAAYRDSVLEDAVLVFAQTGVISRATALDAIRKENDEGRRWADVQLQEVCSLRLGEQAFLLTYRVAARWENQTAVIHAFASSIYIERAGSWKLIFHQQTPLSAV